MKNYSGSNVGSKIGPALWNAQESVWIISPWIGKDYAESLVLLSQKEIEVRIITSNHDNNLESIQTLKSSPNSNLKLLILDRDRSAFIHAKMYIADNQFAFSGSANLTFSGFNYNVETLSIAETEDEVHQIAGEFSRIWMTFEREGMSKEDLSLNSSCLIRDSLPLVHDFGEFDFPKIQSKKLVYIPYYFCEYSYRTSVGNSPPVLFEKHDFVMLDAVTRQFVHNDHLLVEEVKNYSTANYVLKPDNKYDVNITEPMMHDLRVAAKLAEDRIAEEGTCRYQQHYRSGTYQKIFVPYTSIINFIRRDFVRVPVWYLEIVENDGSHHLDVVFGSSGRKWGELIYCINCQRKVWTGEAIICDNCGKKICNNCVKKLGIVFKKKLCKSCYLLLKNT